MKTVVMGGFGLVGASVVEILRRQGHEVTAASRRTGVDVLSGSGLDDALRGADVVVDVLNSPSFQGGIALEFFETSTNNLLAAEAAAGVGHHVALSIVGAERLSSNGYFRAKHAQERKVHGSRLPFTLLRATQFFEFLGSIADFNADDDAVRLAPARIQPIAARDVAVALSQLAQGRPENETIELAGPDPFRLDEIVRTYLAAVGDGREVISDPAALYFGAALNDETLMTGEIPRFGHTEFDAWLRRVLRERSTSAQPASFA